MVYFASYSFLDNSKSISVMGKWDAQKQKYVPLTFGSMVKARKHLLSALGKQIKAGDPVHIFTYVTKGKRYPELGRIVRTKLKCVGSIYYDKRMKMYYWATDRDFYKIKKDGTLGKKIL